MYDRIWLTTAMVAALTLVACTSLNDLEVIDGSGSMGSIDFPIYNGAPPDAPHHDAVVSLHELTKDGNSVYVGPFCTGTLIAEDVVLTAAHCLNTGTGPKVRTLKPSLLAIYVGDEPAVDIIDHLYLTTETLIHPDFNPYSLTDDIALVRLGVVVTEPVTPVEALPAAAGFVTADIGTDLNFAGFGVDEGGVSGVKMQGDWPLGGLGCTVNGCPGAGDTATQISYTQGNGGPCFGDSGGPAFIDRAGTWYVGGITSYGDADCLVYGVSTRADAYETFIGDFTNTTPPPDCSADGWCNPDCAEYEDPDCGSPPNDCGNGVCDADESCDGRNGTVSCPADCAGKTTGKPTGRFCYVGGTCEGAGCP